MPDPAETIRRRLAYWEGEMPDGDDKMAALTAAYRWLRAEASRRREGDAERAASSVLVEAIEQMYQAAKMLTALPGDGQRPLS
jgi:hypothetical protein